MYSFYLKREYYCYFLCYLFNCFFLKIFCQEQINNNRASILEKNICLFVCLEKKILRTMQAYFEDYGSYKERMRAVG